MTTTKKEIINYGLNNLFTRYQYESLLQPMDSDIFDYMYIVLSRKDDVNDNTNNMLPKYLYSISKACPLIKSSMYSKLGKYSGSISLTLLAKKHLYNRYIS